MKKMGRILVPSALAVLAFIANAAEPKPDSSSTCNFPAIYNLGDSNSDTGGSAAVFYPPVPPFGKTYFHKPSGRDSDGRLAIDFIADHLGLPYLSAFLDTIGTNYRHGANFATGGATILRPDESWFKHGRSPFSLEIQVEQYTQLKDRTTSLYNQGDSAEAKSRLPRPEDFPKALYTLDIGQNDVTLGIIRNLTYDAQNAAIPKIVDLFTSQVKLLYQRGARTFWIHNTGPIGCIPLAILLAPRSPGDLDKLGCVKSYNEISMEFNKQLKDKVIELRAELTESCIVYVDIYHAKYELTATANSQGFGDPFKICCGYNGVDYHVFCGKKGKVNGTEVFAGSCAHPSKVISWDGVHLSEAAHKWIANRIFNGSLSDPPTPIEKACHKTDLNNSLNCDNP